MESATEAEFLEFVVARRDRLLRTAFLLTGDESRARKLLQMSVARARRHWRRITHFEDPETYLLGQMVMARASRRQQWISWGKGIRDRQGERRPDRGDAPEGMWEVLHTLPPRTRAVLVLRHYEEVPEDDVAYLAGCSLQTVQREERRGLERLQEVLPEEVSDAAGGAAT